MLIFWIVVGLIVTALVLGAFGLSRLGSGASQTKTLFTGAMAASVVAFVVAVGGAVTSGDEGADEQPSGMMVAEDEATEDDRGAEAGDASPTDAQADGGADGE